MYIIDFGLDMPEREAALYEAPFEYVLRQVRPTRQANAAACCRERWWIHHNARPEMRRALWGLHRYLATPRLTKHRLFVWLDPRVLPDSQVIAIARDDDFSLGVLQSRVHELWALALGTQLETRPRYTPTSTFETFPFPRPTDVQRDSIGEAASQLVWLRDGWLNPPGLDPVELEKRTLTNLYNERPTWLQHAHAALDAEVSAAYGWPVELPDEEILVRLLALNLEREPS